MSNELDSVASRFVYLFESHGVPRDQIAYFFGNGLTDEDVAINKSLSPKLTPKILQLASELFAIRLEWLEGETEQIYSIHRFYEYPAAYDDFLSCVINDDKRRAVVKMIVSTDPCYEEDALLVIEEEIDYIGNTPIIRYHLCGDWVNRFWKSRTDLTACVALTLKQGVEMNGWKTNSRIDRFCAGEGFVNDLYSLPRAYKRNWFFRKYYLDWNPDYWIFDVDAFLDGIDESDFGKLRALKRWLYYSENELLETGDFREPAHAEFNDFFEKYKAKNEKI